MEDIKFLNLFETQKLNWKDWNHCAHIRMAYLMICKYGLIECDGFIISGIKSYNRCHQDKITHGFNSTITWFWIEKIKEKYKKERYKSSIDFIESNKDLLNFAQIFDYYSKAELFSDNAKNSIIKVALFNK
jgi:hypothetical protein